MSNHPAAADRALPPARFYTEESPAVASNGGGEFAVVWEGNDGFRPGIFGQRFESAIPSELTVSISGGNGAKAINPNSRGVVPRKPA